MHHILLQLNPESGLVIRTFWQLGWGLGFMRNPTDFCFLGTKIYVADAGNARLVSFSKGSAKTEAFPAEGILRIAAYRDEALFAFFEKDRSLWMLDSQGRRIARLAVALQSVAAMAPGKDLLAISDPQANRVVVLKIERKTKPLQVELR